MHDRTRALEIKVGIFIVTGFLAIAAMVIQFGQVGQGFNRFYDVTVTFANAGGLIRNGDVQLAGARIGYIADTPRLNDSMTGVIVPLKIREGQRIPRATKFQIGSSGLLGDKFVEIVPSADFDPATFNAKDESLLIQPGDQIVGTQTGGLEALQRKGEEVLESLKNTSEELRVAIASINSGVLVDENQKNLTATFENLRKTSESFVAASDTAKTVVADAGKVVAQAQSAVATAGKAMESTQIAASELKLALEDSRKLIASAQATIRMVQAGPGLVPALLADKQMSDDVRAFIANLRERGVLFYKDRSEPKPATTPRPRR